MALTKETKIDQIMVTESGFVFIRETTTIKEDGVEITKKYHRTSFMPGQDVSDQPANVQAVCKAVWTPEVIAAYKAKQEETRLNTTGVQA